jgi:hypothetical protein
MVTSSRRGLTPAAPGQSTNVNCPEASSTVAAETIPENIKPANTKENFFILFIPD